MTSLQSPLAAASLAAMMVSRVRSSPTTTSLFASTADLATSLANHNFAIIQAGKAELVAVCYSLAAPSNASGSDAVNSALLHAKLDLTAKSIEWTLKSESQSFAEIASRYISATFP